MENSCQRCGKCCTSFGVLVTPFDVQRIAKATGKKPEEFVTTLPEPPSREREEPVILIDGERSLLVLKWIKGRGQDCWFYTTQGCAIYENRPMLCRTYPFKKKERKLIDMKSRACPCGWMPDKSGMKEYEEAIAEYEKELKAYKKIADEWNRLGGGTLKEFLSKWSGNRNDQKHKIFGQLQSKLLGNFGAQDCFAILLL